MKQQSQGSRHTGSWTRLVGVVLALLIFTTGSMAVASEPAVDSTADTILAQAQPDEAPTPADTTTPDEPVDTSTDTESTETAQVQPERSHPFGHTSMIYYNRRR